MSGAKRKHETYGFTRRYRVDRLVYYEVFRYVNNAILRETEIKAWRRGEKVALLEATNPLWDDLAAGWGKFVPFASLAKSRFLVATLLGMTWVRVQKVRSTVWATTF